jgi:hypothetical protein
MHCHMNLVLTGGLGSGFIDSGSGSRLFMTKNWEKVTAEKFFIDFLIIISINLYLGLHKECPCYRKAFSPQKRTSSTSKHEISVLFYFCGSFLPSWIRIRIRNTSFFKAVFCLTSILNLQVCPSRGDVRWLLIQRISRYSRVKSPSLQTELRAEIRIISLTTSSLPL